MALVPGGVVTGVVQSSATALPSSRTCIHRQTNGQCVEPTADDADADGVPAARDCNDNDPYAYPGAPEMLCNGVDEDCDGVDKCPVDRDHDGFSPPADCDDADARRNPRATEIFCNGIDENCNGYDDCDADGDGESIPGDCNDKNSGISPQAKEIACDGVDQDCDGKDCCDNDEDGDGTPCRADCDDKDPRAFPGAPVPPGCWGKDLNCDGKPDGVCRH